MRCRCCNQICFDDICDECLEEIESCFPEEDEDLRDLEEYLEDEYDDYERS